jgi:hypothetical protein
MRLTTQQSGEHHVTIPDHANLRIGTLARIIADVAERSTSATGVRRPRAPCAPLCAPRGLL